MGLADDLLVQPDPARRHQPVRQLPVADEPRMPQPLVETDGAATLKAPPGGGPGPRTASLRGPGWPVRRLGPLPTPRHGRAGEGRGARHRSPAESPGLHQHAELAAASPASAASAGEISTWPPARAGPGSGPRSARECRPAARRRRNLHSPRPAVLGPPGGAPSGRGAARLSCGRETPAAAAPVPRWRPASAAPAGRGDADQTAPRAGRAHAGRPALRLPSRLAASSRRRLPSCSASRNAMPRPAPAKLRIAAARAAAQCSGASRRATQAPSQRSRRSRTRLVRSGVQRVVERSAPGAAPARRPLAAAGPHGLLPADRVLVGQRQRGVLGSRDQLSHLARAGPAGPPAGRRPSSSRRSASRSDSTMVRFSPSIRPTTWPSTATSPLLSTMAA